MAFLLPPYSKYHIIIFGSLALLASFVFLFLATNFKLSQKQDPEPVISPITAEELQKDETLKESLTSVQNGESEVTWATNHFVILDIRSEEDYNQQHLAGAQNAPIEFLPASSLNPDVNMVVYSDNEDHLTKAASILADKGIRDIYLLHDSLEKLQSQGYTLEEGVEE